MPRTFFSRTFGNNTGAASPPPVPTFSVSDNGDGTGGVAAITGSNASSTNEIWSAIWTGTNGTLTRSSVGSRTGDGTVALSLTNGQRIAYVKSTLSGLTSVSSDYVFTTSGGSGTITTRSDGVLDTILTRIRTKLTQSVAGLTTDTCYICLRPDEPPAASPGDMFVTISPMSGVFDQSLIDGGGVFQTTDETGVLVKIYSTIQEDEARHDHVFLTDATRGVIGMMQKVLKVMTVLDLDDTVNRVLRQPIFPVSHTFFQHDRSLGGVEIEFKILFDWAIS